jgi:endonuclease G
MRSLALSLLLVAACGPAPSPATPTAPPPPVTPPPSRPAAPSDGSAIDRSIHLALGTPRDGDPSDDYLMDKVQYVVDYNARLNGPNWVAWHLERGDLGRAPRSPGFKPDDALPQGFYVVKDHDYTGSGYDRGHLCPSADRTASPALNATTFVMTNVHPQLHELNAGPWEKLEEHERELAKRGRDLFIVAGGVFEREPKRIGRDPDPAHRVAVPRASYKIIVVLDHGQGAESVRPDTEVIAVVMPNTPDVKDHAWSDYAVTIREIEQTTGYDFLGRVPRPVQDAVETKGPPRVALR